MVSASVPLLEMQSLAFVYPMVHTIWSPTSRLSMKVGSSSLKDGASFPAPHLSCECLLQQLDRKPFCGIHTLGLTPAVEVLKHLQ